MLLLALVLAVSPLALSPGMARAGATVIGSCRIEIRTECPGANLSNQNLSGVMLSYSNLRGANLSGANLTGAQLWGAKLDGANLTGAILTGANLERAALDGATLSGAKMERVDLRSSSLSSAVLQRTDLTGARLNNAKVIGSQFDYANLSTANMQAVQANNANFAIADMKDVEAYEGNFRNANFYGTHLEAARFAAADLQQASFRGAYFAKTWFRSAAIQGATVLPSTIASDPMASGFFFRRVYTHVNAYNPYGSCTSDSSSRAAQCKGRNDDPNATEPFKNEVSFGWGSTRSDGLRGFDMKIPGGEELIGTVSDNLGAFMVQAGYGGAFDAGPTFSSQIPPGQIGGPLALHVGYHRELFGSGYSLNANGWVQRASRAGYDPNSP